MPAIFSAEKVKKAYELFQLDKSRSAIAKELSVDMDDVNHYILAGLKKFNPSMLKYGKSDHSNIMTLFDLPERKNERPKAEYSNKNHWEE